MPEPMTPTQVANQFAPYPIHGTPVTSEAIERYLTVQAFVTLNIAVPGLLHEWEAAGLPGTGPLRDAYVYAVLAVSAQYGTVYLLREAGPCSLPVEKLVEGVVLPYDGEMHEVAEALETWLVEYGIDPEAVLQAAGIDQVIEEASRA